jgi:hypothetical protein
MTVGDQRWGVDVVVSRAPQLKNGNDDLGGCHQGQPRRTTQGHHATSRHGLVRLVSSPRGVATLQTNRVYARGVCEGIAVHASELSLCVGRICVACAGRNMCLLCWRLVRSVRVCVAVR